MNNTCYFDDSDCNYRSPFNLLCSTEKEARKVDAKIETAIRKCVERIKEIGKLHKGAGIGDTSTDEAIADKFYSELHWRL